MGLTVESKLIAPVLGVSPFGKGFGFTAVSEARCLALANTRLALASATSDRSTSCPGLNQEVLLYILLEIRVDCLERECHRLNFDRIAAQNFGHARRQRMLLIRRVRIASNELVGRRINGHHYVFEFGWVEVSGPGIRVKGPR